MKKYIEPAVEIEKFDSTDIITLSGASILLEDEFEDDYSAADLGLSK